MLTGNHEKEIWYDEDGQVFPGDLYTRYITHQPRCILDFFLEKSSFNHIAQCRNQSPILWKSSLEAVVCGSMSLSVIMSVYNFFCQYLYQLDLRYQVHTRWRRVTSD